MASGLLEDTGGDALDGSRRGSEVSREVDDPILLEHRDSLYSDFIGVPLDF